MNRRAVLAAAPPAFVLLIASAAAGAVVDGSFAGTGNDTTPRFFHRAGRLADGRALVSGGLGLQLFPPSLLSLDDLSFYDPASGAFSASYAPSDGGPPVSPLLAVPRSSHTQTTLLDGRVLFTGGRTGASGTSPGTGIASVELFDPRSGEVSAGPALSVARAGHTATLLPDGRVVVAGGSTWEIFQPGPPDPPGIDSWSMPRALARSRSDHAAVLLADARVLLAGGSGSGPDTIETLDPDGAPGSLSGALLAVGVDDLAAVRLDDGGVLIVGGQDLVTGDTVSFAYRYDPAADALSPAPPPPDRAAGIADHQLVALGRFAALFGGEEQAAGADTELDYAALYDRAAGAWVFVTTMGQVRDDFASVRLDDDRILLVAGGVPLFGAEVPSATAELFTPSTLRPPDLNGDANVGFTDLSLLLGEWGTCPCPPECAADLDFSGGVGFSDLNLLLDAWGACP